MNKQLLLVDMDEVISKGGFLKLINKFLGTNYTEDDFKDYYMQEIIDDKKAFFEYVTKENIYDYAILLDDCAKVLKKLNKKYNLFIATSYIWKDAPLDSGMVLYHKFEYLKKVLPFITPYQYIFISDKSIIPADIIIDDRPKNLVNSKRKLMFTAYHNKEITNEYLKENNIERVNNWKEIEKLL